jgi:hypothetical protein
MQLQSKTDKWRADKGVEGDAGSLKNYLLAIKIKP